MDERLRTRQRAGHPTIALAEQTRAGELTPERVELAARLGHADATPLHPGLAPLSWPDEAREAVQAAKALLGPTLPAQLAADYAERVLPLWEAKFPADPRPRLAIEAARAWASCPCPSHQQAAEVASGDADRAAHQPRLPEAERPSPEARREAAEAALLHALLGDPTHPSQRPEPDAAQEACSAATEAAAAAYGPAFAADSAAFAANSAAFASPDLDAERTWQRLRLAAYLLGRV